MEYSSYTCPECWSNSLVQVVGPQQLVHLMSARWYLCEKCNWFGSSFQLQSPSSSEEILECMLEDQARGKAGGSSSNGGKGRFSGKNKRLRGERDTWDDGVCGVRTHTLARRSKIVRWQKLSIAVTEREYSLLQAMAGSRYISRLRPRVQEVLGRSPSDAQELRTAFSLLALDILTPASGTTS